jgi:hypothetical protein
MVGLPDAAVFLQADYLLGYVGVGEGFGAERLVPVLGALPDVPELLAHSVAIGQEGIPRISRKLCTFSRCGSDCLKIQCGPLYGQGFTNPVNLARGIALFQIGD